MSVLVKLNSKFIQILLTNKKIKVTVMVKKKHWKKMSCYMITVIHSINLKYSFLEKLNKFISMFEIINNKRLT